MEASRASLIQHLQREGISDEAVLAAMGKVPRELFVPPSTQYLAYADMPLPIGQGQTISQPYIIALMTQALALTGKEKVLEIGCGSGYHAAILAELAAWVVSLERLESLASQAKRLLDRLGYRNIEIHVADGTLGWEREAPYEAIIVTAAAPAVPPPLLDQLADGGTLVIPVGSLYSQSLYAISKRDRKIQRRDLGSCRFVPLVGQFGWSEEEVAEWEGY
ncbi:MAG: protein-L-isoaspartate(D-aspartate) O-methyltransferase [Chloroflexi bacterium]|nr:protein-L-isoaspartate(D-aspartate) O-methyltransferase [Chloroflexota bacterium]MCL5074757.1 protein-L-isoaspartate(D-aspartate) O-methyltransferase [Chloroflexota bacterium]